MEDKYVLFDVFDRSSIFQGSLYPHNGYPKPSDEIALPSNFPVLGTQFTIEASFYVDEDDHRKHQTLIGTRIKPTGQYENRPPMITVNLHESQIRYGFGYCAADDPDGCNDTIKQVRFEVDDVITTNKWHHVAFTFDGKETGLYIDGELVHSSDAADGLTPHPTPITVIGRYFLGKIDEVRAWNIPRTQE